MSSVAGFVSACRRRAERYPVRRAGEVLLEFDSPEEQTLCLDVLDMSPGGLSFGLRDGRPELKVGSTVDNVVIHIGETTVRGRMTITHVTKEFSSGTVCGAAFLPESETDRHRLDSAIVKVTGSEKS